MRIAKAILAFLLAAVMLLLAWLVPAYLRSVDIDVVREAGEDSTTVVERGLGLLELEQFGAARMLSEAATDMDVERADFLRLAVERFEDQNPALLSWGGIDPYVQQILVEEHGLTYPGATNALQTLLPQPSRTALGAFLAESRRPGVQQILANRLLTNTVHFPPVRTAAGQPLETAILMAGLLHQSDSLTDAFRRELEAAVVAANLGKGTQAAELCYLDLLSVARRMNWGQLTTLVGRLASFDELESFVNLMARAGERLPQFYTIVLLAKDAGDAIRHLETFGIDALPDMELAAQGGAGALNLLVERGQMLEVNPLRDTLTAKPPFDTIYYGFLGMASKTPVITVYFKYLFILIACFLIAVGVGALLPLPSEYERTMRVKNLGFARQSVMAVLLLLVIMVFAEPHLFDEHQSEQPLPRWKFPMVNAAISAQITKPIESFMNQITIASLAGFLVLQLILYVICLLRIAEIRKQPISSDLKLKLLENEENMFDSGLYVGLGGTVVSLVFIALGITGPGLMAAYSSTLFGIIFVAIIKICHLRPFRRRLILETEFKG